MVQPSVYIETTIVSYQVARPSSNLLTAACQQATTQWWEERRRHFELFTSELVVEEAKAGEPVMAAKRLDLLIGVPELAINDRVKRLAAAFIARGALPYKAQADALHIAVAAVHEVNYLLTWNCRHIDNPSSKPAVRAICKAKGYGCPEICTPIEIMEVHQHGG